ncbi:MAG: serine/threonine-protein kinase [Byssovorax sp.]
MTSRIIDGKYEVVRCLGEGGMGVIFEAKDVQSSRRVAVKVIAAALLAKGPEAATRFKREMKATIALDTPHIARVLDSGMDPAGGDPYIAMELLEGEDLKQLVERLGPLQPEVALRIVAQACIGLTAAHDAGIIHRDIKSANLFLAHDASGEITVKILDFGIAKVVDSSRAGGQNTDLTHTGSMLGSPRYMSPEQARGQRDVGCQSDLWSLGVVLHELLTGTTPHAEIESVYALVVAIGSVPPPAVRRRAPWVLPEHEAFISRALQIDPEERFASASEMLRAIRALLPGGSSLDCTMLVPLPDETRRSLTQINATADGSLAIGASSRSVGARRPSPKAVLFTAVALALALLLVGGLLARTGGAMKASATSPPAPATTERVQSVRLAVTPDAAVEIDGRATPVEDGAVALSGAIGSVHLVRLAKSGQQVTAEVVITERGALPPSVKLEVALPASATVATAASAPRPTARQSPPARPPPAPALKDPRPATDFE